MPTGNGQDGEGHRRSERSRGTFTSASLGFDFAAAVLGFALVGYWVDLRYDSRPWGILCGALLGLVGAMYNLIRGALRAGSGSSVAGKGREGSDSNSLKQSGDER